jgi:hypothetical protein
MEKNHEDHQCKLFIAYDTPNQGAYGSLAGQHLLTDINKVSTPLFFLWFEQAKAIWDRVKFINSVAGKQMLVYHYSAQVGKKAKPHPYRTSFLDSMAIFPNNGYPAKCRNISISCGNGYGIGQGYNAGTEQIKLDTTIGSVKYFLKINALPNHTQLEILDLEMELKVPWKFLWRKGYSWVPIPFLSNIRESVDNTEPYDNCPGGNYGMLKGLGNVITDELGQNVAYGHNECFLPTVSALDLNKDSLESWDNANYLLANFNNNLHFINGHCEINDHNITPFDALYVTHSNLSHITGGGINDTTVYWIDKEINRDTILFNNIEFLTERKQYEANKSIIASSPNKHVVIANTADISYLAGESIILNPGFHVYGGATFSAIIHKYKDKYAYSSSQNTFASAPSAFYMPRKTNIATSVKNVKEDNRGLSITPNPAHGSFILKMGWDNNVSGIIFIYNSMGNLVYKEKMNGPIKNIQINQPSGVYLLKATSGVNSVVSGKLIINI